MKNKWGLNAWNEVTPCAKGMISEYLWVSCNINSRQFNEFDLILLVGRSLSLHKTKPNSKEFFNTALLAMSKYNYCFMLLKFGSYGSNNDSGMLEN